MHHHTGIKEKQTLIFFYFVCKSLLRKHIHLRKWEHFSI